VVDNWLTDRRHVDQSCLTRGMFSMNGEVPRGWHPWIGSLVFCKNFLDSMGFEPVTSSTGLKVLAGRASQPAHGGPLNL
jgi:hypothetical protein